MKTKFKTANDLANLIYPNLEKIGSENSGVSYDTIRECQRSAFEFGYQHGYDEREKEFKNINNENNSK